MQCGYDAERALEEAYEFGDELAELGAAPGRRGRRRGLLLAPRPAPDRRPRGARPRAAPRAGSRRRRARSSRSLCRARPGTKLSRPAHLRAAASHPESAACRRPGMSEGRPPPSTQGHCCSSGSSWPPSSPSCQALGAPSRARSASSPAVTTAGRRARAQPAPALRTRRHRVHPTCQSPPPPRSPTPRPHRRDAERRRRLDRPGGEPAARRLAPLRAAEEEPRPAAPRARRPRLRLRGRARQRLGVGPARARRPALGRPASRRLAHERLSRRRGPPGQGQLPEQVAGLRWRRLGRRQHRQGRGDRRRAGARRARSCGGSARRPRRPAARRRRSARSCCSGRRRGRSRDHRAARGAGRGPAAADAHAARRRAGRRAPGRARRRRARRSRASCSPTCSGSAPSWPPPSRSPRRSTIPTKGSGPRPPTRSARSFLTDEPPPADVAVRVGAAMLARFESEPSAAVAAHAGLGRRRRALRAGDPGSAGRARERRPLARLQRRLGPALARGHAAPAAARC